jgi:hypothetical protein
VRKRALWLLLFIALAALTAAPAHSFNCANGPFVNPRPPDMPPYFYCPPMPFKVAPPIPPERRAVRLPPLPCPRPMAPYPPHGCVAFDGVKICW